MTDKERALLISAQAYQDQRDDALAILWDLIHLVDHFERTDTHVWEERAASVVQSARDLVAMHEVFQTANQPPTHVTS